MDAGVHELFVGEGRVVAIRALAPATNCGATSAGPGRFVGAVEEEALENVAELTGDDAECR